MFFGFFSRLIFTAYFEKINIIIIKKEDHGALKLHAEFLGLFASFLDWSASCHFSFRRIKFYNGAQSEEMKVKRSLQSANCICVNWVSLHETVVIWRCFTLGDPHHLIQRPFCRVPPCVHKWFLISVNTAGGISVERVALRHSRDLPTCDVITNFSPFLLFPRWVYLYTYIFISHVGLTPELF